MSVREPSSRVRAQNCPVNCISVNVCSSTAVDFSPMVFLNFVRFVAVIFEWVSRAIDRRRAIDWREPEVRLLLRAVLPEVAGNSPI
jgi:hypothetical protein